jgi:hypothetical protein
VSGHPVFLICFAVLLSVFEEILGQYLDHIAVAPFQTLSSSFFAIQYAIDDIERELLSAKRSLPSSIVAHLVIALSCHVTLFRCFIGIISLSQAFFLFLFRAPMLLQRS